MFKCKATDHDKQPTTIREHSKIPGCCLMVAVASTIQAIKSPLEPTSHNHLRSLDWMGRACGLVSQVTGHHINGILHVGPY